MSFSWSNCTVITKNIKNRKKAKDCYRVIYRFKNYLTPNIIVGLQILIDNRMRCYGAYRIKPKDIENDITELLKKCCNVDSLVLLMQRDVEKVETEIILHIKRSIELQNYRGIYEENIPLETYEDYKNRHIVTPKDVEDYFKGVPIFD